MVISVVQPAEVVQIEPNGDVVVRVALGDKSWRLVCAREAFDDMPYPDIGDSVLLFIRDEPEPQIQIMGMDLRPRDTTGELSPQGLAAKWKNRNPFGVT